MKRKAYLSVSKVLQFSLLTLLLLTFLLISGCTPISNLLFGDSGSIEVSTYPSGAKIFLNNADTGYVTPYTIINLPKGTYEVKVTLGDVSYTKTVIVYSDHTTSVYKDLLARLNKIIVQPTSVNLEVGESLKIDSVTAYYIDSGSVALTLSDCSYSSSSSHATVSSGGTVTGVSEGSATITISYTDVDITKTDTVNVTIAAIPVVNSMVYRALLVGVGNYENYGPPPDGDLNGPPYDVDRMIEVFNQCKFGSDEIEFSPIVSLKDLNATKTAIINGITSTFSEADENDISYFYFSGHGAYGEGFSTSYILPTDFDGFTDSAISVDELESVLSAIPGTKIVIFDSCYSGGFIGKSKGKIIISKEELISFNDEIINIFSQAQFKGLLTTNQYKVLTACHYYQTSIDVSPLVLGDFDPFGLFTAVFCDGCGYGYTNWPLNADTNSNYKIALDEMYDYILNLIPLLEIYYSIDNRQDVQVFPENSNFTIIEY